MSIGSLAVGGGTVAVELAVEFLRPFFLVDLPAAALLRGVFSAELLRPRGHAVIAF